MKYFRIAIIVLFLAEAGYLLHNETAEIAVCRYVIQDNELASALEGVKVAHISDLHIRRAGLLENRLVKAINDIDPQIIFITGDFLSGNKGVGPCVTTIKRISEGRLVIAILGNGDHSYKQKYIDTELLVKGLKSAGVKLLRNESIVLKIKIGATGKYKNLYVVGLDDNYLLYDDIFKAMNNVPSKSPKILLAHSPSIIDTADTAGVNLVLSGHTHGGQVILPFFGPLYLNPAHGSKRKLVAGLYNYETKVFVNKGIGTTMLPFRLFCRPEVAVLNFVKERSIMKDGVKRPAHL